MVYICCHFVCIGNAVRTVYLLRRKCCARFGFNFSIILLCQVKILDEKNTRHVYLLGKKYKQTSCSPVLTTVRLKFSSSYLSHTFAANLDVLAIQSCIISGSIVTSARNNQNKFLFFFSIDSIIFRIA